MDEDGVIRLSANAAFIDPPALLSSGYVDHIVDPAAYYTRTRPLPQPPAAPSSRKRKRKQRILNQKELRAEHRHQEARSALLEAHRAFLSNEPGQARLKDALARSRGKEDLKEQINFVELAQMFQAPLYEATFDSQDSSRSYPVFGYLIESDSSREELATCAGSTFILPRASRFFMSEFSRIGSLAGSRRGFFNLLLIDPPWENKSVRRRSLYPTLPNKYLLSLPLQQLVHPEGALVALWITNREKLRDFVERELFPAWELRPVGVWYWLKVTEGGQLVSELDSPHHKPYECLLLATTKSVSSGELMVPRNFVAISLPGEHSRKPPLGLLLSDFAPGPKPVKALELFAREMYPAWTSWGNEPLRFQNTIFFRSSTTDTNQL